MSTEPPDTPDTEPIEPTAPEPAAAAAEPTPVPAPATPAGPAATPRPSATLTWALVGVALVLAGFLGGYFVGHHADDHGNRSAFMRHGFGRSHDGFGPRFGVFPGGANGGFNGGVNGPTAPSAPNAQGGFPIAGDFVVGTVTRVSGSSVYVRERDGSTVKVDTDSHTLVRVGTNGGLSDLQPGAAVVVRGTPNGQGEITASFIAQIGRYASGTATT